MKFLKVVLFFVWLLSICPDVRAAEGRAECFPFERLSEDKRKRAEELLLKALDSEALYTIAADIKPMSSGFATFSFDVREPSDTKRLEERNSVLAGIAETREILRHFRCGDALFAEMQVFARSFEGKRFAEAVILNENNLRTMLGQRKEFFSRWGIAAAAHPLTVLYAVENADATPRYAGYGYLFGYPDHAVRFFVTAAVEEELTGRFVERDFYSIETFSNPTNRFVYAVAKGHKETESDRKLKERSEKVLVEYRRRRAKYIGEGKAGVLELIRDWFCPSNGSCSIPASP